MEKIYQLALMLVPNIGDVQARLLLQFFENAQSIFNAPLSTLEKIEGIGEVRARSIKSFNGFNLAEKEWRFLEKHGIQFLFYKEDNYPRRLGNCYDAPIGLFYKGQANLNLSRTLAIVGTRSNSEYGKQITEKLIKDLANEEVLIISGLALGIDALAHKAALKYHLPTVGVVGHGLDKMYPPDNLQLARDMIQEGGGLLTEFFSGTKPDKHNFPLRNRIVAGLSDATVLVETTVKGGSMITAKLADSYNRDVFAVPGRTIDKYSSGCNHLIQHNKAILLTEAQELLEVMGWKEKKKEVKKQKELFVELTADEMQIVKLLQEKEILHIDEININSGLSSSTVASAILQLELQGLVMNLPGKRYKLSD